ncbi:MAG: hypothetical protein H6835_15180 [Planctomycetes bacterium]|nr:hypothetical protein [Planctomycetota bacterium]
MIYVVTDRPLAPTARDELTFGAIDAHSRDRLAPLLAGRHGIEVFVDGRCCCAFPSVAADRPIEYTDELFAERDEEDRARASRCVGALCAALHDALQPGEHADVYPVWSDDEGEPSLGRIALRIGAVDVDRLCFVERFVHEFSR